MTIELVYFGGCPYVDDARSNLALALGVTDGPVPWTEWDLDDPSTPGRVRGYSSPAVLVENQHVFGEPQAAEFARSCRAGGAPSVAEIDAFLRLDLR